MFASLELSYLVSLLVATGIGFIIGLEREFRLVSEKDHFAGIRTFPLIAMLGCILAFISQSVGPLLLVGGFTAFILFVAVTYFIRSGQGHTGITTEISLMITFALGAMASLHLIKEALGAAVITTTLLSLKAPFRSFVAKITEDELYAFIKFIVLSLLLLPFLPDVAYGPSGILNPLQVGVIVVIVSSISFASYLLIKFMGTGRGILLTAFLGGLFSSTAVTWLFSSKSKTSESAAPVYGAGIVLASTIMVVRVALLTFIFNRELFLRLSWACVIMFLTGVAVTFFFSQKATQTHTDAQVQVGNPLNMSNAIGFGMLFVGIVMMVYYAKEYLGEKGLILSGWLSGLADVDAISIAMSKMATAESMNLAIRVIVCAMISNTIVKIVIAVAKGAPALRLPVILGLTLSSAGGAIYAFLMI